MAARTRTLALCKFLWTSLFLLVSIAQNTLAVISTQRYEAEGSDASWFNCQVTNRHPGYSGTGYLDFEGQNSWVEWDIEIERDGYYEVTVRYSAKGSRPATLFIDSKKAASFEFTATLDWSTWQTETRIESFTTGRHKLRIESFESLGPNIDWMSLRSEELMAALSHSSHTTMMTTTHGAEYSITSQASSIAETTVLELNAYISKGEFVSSPSGEFKIGLSDSGDLELRNLRSIVTWSAGILNGDRCYMQRDGNLVIRDNNFGVVWASNTHANEGARFVINDSGRIAVVYDGDELWMVAPSIEERIALEANEFLSLGEFRWSPSGAFMVGLSASGNLVLQDSQSNLIWSAGISNGNRCYMQPDGNLVVRDGQNGVTWASHTGGHYGAQFVIDDVGRVSIVDGNTTLWIEGSGSDDSTNPTALSPSYAQNVVLETGGFLSRGKFVHSPSGEYRMGLSNNGDLILQDRYSNTIWAAGATNGFRCYMQDDGNLIVRDDQYRAQWTATTSGNNGARLVVDDSGRIAVIHGVTPLWIQGIPRGTYKRPSRTNDLQFPIRGAFYYPWYPETWSVNGHPARFVPDLGFYSYNDPTVPEEHIDALEYAYVDLSIASWWGPDTNLDKARITLLMDETVSLNSRLKWTVYHEDEYHEDDSPEKIRKDLDYLKRWFAWHAAWAHMDKRPVIFVYNEAGCEVVDRWMAANGGEWYVVLKLFKGYRDCPTQPDSWHQYGPGDAVVRIPDVSYSVSPGFWRADIERPLLPRVTKVDFCHNVEDMVGSGDPWQLITTFNEAGEGTMVEASSPHWGSDTKYGFYLDCLHAYH